MSVNTVRKVEKGADKLAKKVNFDYREKKMFFLSELLIFVKYL